MGDNEELIQRIKEIKWFHSIPIRDGIVTPGFDNSMDKLGQVCLPAVSYTHLTLPTICSV